MCVCIHIYIYINTFTFTYILCVWCRVYLLRAPLPLQPSLGSERSISTRKDPILGLYKICVHLFLCVQESTIP